MYINYIINKTFSIIESHLIIHKIPIIKNCKNLTKVYVELRNQDY